jgi:GT2 family glycosyltransferase
MKNIKVEIVTPVYNRRELTVQCLRSLSRIDRTNLDVHVIVVDSGSTDGTVEAIRTEFPAVEIIEADDSLWYTAAANRGFVRALEHKPDYILTVNDDGIFDSKFLISLIDCAESNPRSVVGALLLLWDKPEKVFQVAPKWDTFYGGWRHFQQQTVQTVPQKAWEVGLIVGNCVLFPAQAIREVGLMNEEKLPQYGDAEFTPRMKKLGWRLLIEPRARVFCQPNTPPKRLSQMSLGELYRSLWQDRRKPHNLRCRFYSYWNSAPSKPQAVAAFSIYIARLGLQAIGFERKEPEEKSLAKEYA